MTEAMQQLIEMMTGNKPRYAIMNPHDYFAIMAKMKNRNAVSRMKRMVNGRHWEYKEFLNKYYHWKYMLDESGWIPFANGLTKGLEIAVKALAIELEITEDAAKRTIEDYLTENEKK